MKKVLVLSFVAGMLVLASCGTGTRKAATNDSVVEQKVAVDTTHAAAAVDTTKAVK